jgi:predicted ribosome quality control (RQC) complex YloA/Tae2 family protein
MYFDALTMSAVADELRVLIGARVQQVVQVDGWSVGFEIYVSGADGEEGEHVSGQRHYLVASAHPQRSRVHLTETKLRRGVEVPTSLLLLLRKFVRGGRITAVDAPEFERILNVEIEPPAELREEQPTLLLVVEAMGRHANVILVDARGIVMDAVKRVPPRLSRVRPILPGKPYRLPPVQAKLDPPDLTGLRLDQMLAKADPAQSLWRALVSEIRGVSPLLAREVVYRATGTADMTVGDLHASPIFPLLDAFQGLWIHFWERDWQPHVAVEAGRVAAFAPYVLTQYATGEPVASISLAVDRFDRAHSSYGEEEDGGAGPDAYAPAKDRVRADLREARERVENRRRSLERQWTPPEELDRLRMCGEMILAYAHTIRRGDEVLEAQVALEGPPLPIALDPQQTAVENAQAYFARYDKAKSAGAEVPALIARADLELAYLDQLATDLDLAANWPEIGEVSTALEEAGYAPKRRGPQMQRGEPLRVAAEEGWLILVGRSARQNHDLTFRRAAPDDLWLHAVDVPGSHVIVRTGGRPVPEGVLQRAAALAAYYSARRGEQSVLVAWTARRYVRPIRGAGPGMVTYAREQTLRVRPARR